MVALVFSMLNLDVANIYFYKGQSIELPLVFILTFEFLAGALIGCSVGIGRHLKLKSNYVQLERELQAAQDKLDIK